MHGEDKATSSRFAYGREIADPAQERKLGLAFSAAEEAMLP